MNKLFTLLFLHCSLLSFNSVAETKLSVDVTMDKLQFQKPPRGVGKAGVIVFKSANVNHSGTVLNINNVNNQFDAQIFVRPTFLGFKTQFGNYGFPLEANGALGALDSTELLNSKLVLDDHQLNLAGEFLSFTIVDSSVKLKTYRLYCQTLAELDVSLPTDAPPWRYVTKLFQLFDLERELPPGK